MASQRQSEKVDLWAAGVVLATMLTRRYPLFKVRKVWGADGQDVAMLGQIIELLGLDAVADAAESMNKYLRVDASQLGLATQQESKLTQLVNMEWKDPTAPELDELKNLMRLLLHPDPAKRISAKDALELAMFAEYKTDETAEAAMDSACYAPDDDIGTPSPLTPVPITPQDDVAGDDIGAGLEAGADAEAGLPQPHAAGAEGRTAVAGAGSARRSGKGRQRLGGDSTDPVKVLEFDADADDGDPGLGAGAGAQPDVHPPPRKRARRAMTRASAAKAEAMSTDKAPSPQTALTSRSLRSRTRPRRGQG